MPRILHTDDDRGRQTDINRYMRRLGIQVDPSPTSEAALKQAQREKSEGHPYAAAILDDNTGSLMNGMQAAAKLINDKLCDGPVILLSTGPREDLVRPLRGQGIAAEQVQIFSKQEESILACLYIAACVHHPDETKGLTRDHLLAWLDRRIATEDKNWRVWAPNGVELTPEEKRGALIADTYNDITFRGEFTLLAMAEEALGPAFGQEGNHTGSPER